MDLKRMIVHEIVKEQNEEVQEVIRSEELLEVDTNAHELLEALLKSYDDDNLLNGRFDYESGSDFPSDFDTYEDSQRTNEIFIDFTQNSLPNLQLLIGAKHAAKGGYLLFAEYENYGRNFMSIFLIRNTEGKVFKRTEDHYSIDITEYVDTRNLAMACRINESLLDSDQNYLSFTKHRQREVSDYFTDWIGVDQFQSMIEELLPLIQVGKSSLTGTVYKGFSKADQPMWLAKTKAFKQEEE